MSKHLFAVYTDVMPTGLTSELRSEVLVHRLLHVLRLSAGEEVILFDGVQQVHVRIVHGSKKFVTVDVLSREHSQAHTLELIWLLPILEREQFEAALYALAVVGTTRIQLVTTEKSRSLAWTDKERERAQRIMIAACEQAKQFVIPELGAPQPLDTVIAQKSTPACKIMFDASGAFVKTCLERMATQKSVVCITGPEAGLTEREMEWLGEHGFSACALTPTILKASHAVLLAAGMLRSWFR